MSDAAHTFIQVQSADFNHAEQYSALRDDCPKIGAIVTFCGLMRDFNDGDDVSVLELEHYPGMTERVLAEIIEQARTRWQLEGVRVIHRIGEMTPSDQIVFVGVSSAHRIDAFAACEFIMDFLKTRAPFWKKEKTRDGQRWVDAKDSDNKATERW